MLSHDFIVPAPRGSGDWEVASPRSSVCNPQSAPNLSRLGSGASIASSEISSHSTTISFDPSVSSRPRYNDTYIPRTSTFRQSFAFSDPSPFTVTTPSILQHQHILHAESHEVPEFLEFANPNSNLHSPSALQNPPPIKLSSTSRRPLRRHRLGSSSDFIRKPGAPAAAIEPLFTTEDPFASTTKPPWTSSSSGGSTRTHSLHGLRRSSDAYQKDATYRRKESVSCSSLRFYTQKPCMDHMPLGVREEQEVVQEYINEVKAKAEKWKPNVYKQKVFQIFWFVTLVSVIYFAFVGYPIWPGIVYSLWAWMSSASTVQYGFLIFFLWATALAWIPLLGTKLEKEVDDPEKRDASETCLIIPAYKAAGALPETIEHALKIFKPHHIFIIANGNSPTPLDDTEDVCKRYGVRHAWVPIGSKITAEYVGVLLAKEFKYIMLIDDDVHLPANLPLVTDRLVGRTACIGYLLASTGENGAKGTYIQQAQDLEYKLSGLTRTFSGNYGSSIFPHGAIILWDRNILEALFWGHPGFSISEDWYFGHTCRATGYRIQFCTQVFVETETPPCLFIPNKTTRGGYGEMTVWKQRFYRWNFFFSYRIRDNLAYMFLGWRLGRYEFVTKLFIIGEIYGTFIFATRPFLLPIAYLAQPKMAGIMTAAVMSVYIVGVIFFNATHLRRKNAMVSWKVIPVYLGMKWCLMFVNTLGIYYALYMYAEFFSKRHLRVIENYDALDAAKKCLDQVASQQEAQFVDEKQHAEIKKEDESEDISIPDLVAIAF